MARDATQSAQAMTLRTPADSTSSQGKDETAMGVISTAAPMLISVNSDEWYVQAQRIIAYPADFGLTREQVGSLHRALAERCGLAGRGVIKLTCEARASSSRGCHQ